MDNSGDVKIIEAGNYFAVFNKNNLSLNIYLRDQLNSSGDRDDEIGNSSKMMETGFHYRDVLRNGTTNHLMVDKKQVEKIDLRPSLQRLSINVSNTCNMACKYCYANGGIYYTHGELMNKDTAINAIAFSFSRFSHIHHINFFGGEPTLNENVIELIYKYIEHLYTSGFISYFPSFGITTNCYILSNHMLEMIRDYKFSISISLDGPGEIHDKLRIDKCGQKTHDAIVSNIKRIINMNITPEFECTYTREHYDSGITIIDLMDYFYNNFGCNILHCPIVVAEPGSDLYIPLEEVSKMYADAVRYTIHNLMVRTPKSLSNVVRILDSLENRLPITDYCSAGESLIAINADGNVFPCFMLMDQTEYCLGNVNEEKPDIVFSDSLHKLLSGANKWSNGSCQKCWAQPLCFGCLGEDIARHEETCRSSIIERSHSCDFKREMIETTLKSIAEAVINQNNS
jgi:uncharacterized protein